MITKTLKTLTIGILISTLILTSCTKEETKTNVTNPTLKSIYEIAKADTSFSILVAAINKAGLKETLSNAGTFTVFAPNNTAFRNEGIDENVINEITDPDEILYIKNELLFHVLGIKVKSTDITNTYVPTLYEVGGNGVSLRTTTNPIKLNNEANVVAANIEATNGIIHVIDILLISPSIADVPIINPSLSTLNSALVKAELVETLYEVGPFTLFAPTNEAFNAINFNLENYTKEQLLPILTSHVLDAQVRSSSIQDGQQVTTLFPSTKLTFNTKSGVKFNGGSVNDITVSTADIQTVNGVVHIISKVVLP